VAVLHLELELTPQKITSSQVYRMARESSDPQAAASEYEQQLRLVMKTLQSAQPSLDLILLGLGEDGY
jgi:6-phosphogluconolactonase/glucosamine-6-phosphate isomerase/deaminase